MGHPVTSASSLLAAQLLRGAPDADAPWSSEEEAGFEYDDGVKIGYLPDSLIYPTAARFQEHAPPAVAPPAVPAGAAHVGGGEQGGLERVAAGGDSAALRVWAWRSCAWEARCSERPRQ
jgi:hypothetical protein